MVFTFQQTLEIIIQLKNFNSLERYGNRGGDSGVSAYEIGSDYIKVLFKGNSKIYTYSYGGKAGQHHVDTMKRLAISGSGLNSYINSNVKNLFDQ